MGTTGTTAANRKVLVLDDAARRRAKAKRDALVEAHAELVWTLAKRLHRRCPDSIELLDLVSIGNLALLEAAARYSPHAHGGTPFAAYVTPRIKGAILDSIRGRNYTAATAGTPLETAPEPAYEPLRGIHEQIDRERTAERVRAAVATLPPDERIVIERYYSPAEPTVDGVAKELNMGRTRTTLLLRDAVRRIRIELDTAAASA